jgi:hypothetical protein
MESEPVRNPFIEKLVPFLAAAEIAALVLTAVGLILQYYQLPNGAECVMLGGSALAIVYFLMAYLPQAGTEATTEVIPRGFSYLLYTTILPKIAFISCSIAVVGLLFGLLHLTGAHQMLTIGASTLLLSCLICGIAILMNNQNLKQLRGPLLRALPLALMAIYWLYTHQDLV